MRRDKVNPRLLARLEEAARALARRFPVKLVVLFGSVAKWGVPLYEAERGLFHEFQIQAFRRYLDDEKFRRAEAEALRRKFGKKE